MIYLIICMFLCIKFFDKSFLTRFDKLCKAHQTVFDLWNIVLDISLLPLLKYITGDFYVPSNAQQKVPVITS